MRLLLVEDSVDLADELLIRLRAEGYACDWLVDGRDALHAPADGNYDIAVLDLGLPGINGLQLLRAWREAGTVFSSSPSAVSLMTISIFAISGSNTCSTMRPST